MCNCTKNKTAARKNTVQKPPRKADKPAPRKITRRIIRRATH